MTVLTIIGAGSTVFAAELMTDFLTAPGLDEGEFRLVDLDADRLRSGAQVRRLPDRAIRTQLDGAVVH